jgi:uncharacterized protein YfiM (DUF2279 family)
MRGFALVMALHFGDAKSPDPWFGVDKAKHFFTSMFVQTAAFGAFRTTGMSRQSSLIGATIVTAGVGVGKELYDRKYGGDPSLRDLAADGAGILAASLLLAHTPR